MKKRKMKSERITLCLRHGWKLFYVNANNSVIKFKRDNVFLAIYQRNPKEPMEVMTALDHPKKGKTTLYRMIETLEELEKILNNPREHMRKEGRIKQGFYLGKNYQSKHERIIK